MNRIDNKNLLNSVLRAISSEGLSGVSAPANSLVSALSAVSAFPEGTSEPAKRAVTANLRRLGLVEITKSKGVMLVQPSVKGVHRLQRSAIDDLRVQPQANWDGVWRMISYDIPARHARQRRMLTSQLHKLGFSLVKDSTWFHPYPCFDAVSELIAYCGLTQYVMVAEIARLDEATLARLLRRYPDLR